MMRKALWIMLFLVILLYFGENPPPIFAVSAIPSLSRQDQPGSQTRLCTQAPRGFANCLAIRYNPAGGMAGGTGSGASVGLEPHELQRIYNLPSTKAGKGETVAIVDAYDNPKAEADLAVYRSAFRLPACTSKNRCFRKVDQDGKKHYPSVNQGWAGEIALDLDMVSAICPNCHILLVEANSNALGDLGRSVDTAVDLGAKIISNSYGAPEDAQIEQSNAHYYTHPGVVITVSSGDDGYSKTSMPAVFPGVVAVGGTSLFSSNYHDLGNAHMIEVPWGGAGSGCSKYIKHLKWQILPKDSVCRTRSVADVSAIADPNTGVAVYNTYNVNSTDSYWSMYGGTSVAAPIIAGVYALAGNAKKIDGSYLYDHAASLNDIAGLWHRACNVLSFSCTSESPYVDLAAGLGTPNGIGAF